MIRAANSNVRLLFYRRSSSLNIQTEFCLQEVERIMIDHGIDGGQQTHQQELVTHSPTRERQQRSKQQRLAMHRKSNQHIDSFHTAASVAAGCRNLDVSSNRCQSHQCQNFQNGNTMRIMQRSHVRPSLTRRGGRTLNISLCAKPSVPVSCFGRFRFSFASFVLRAERIVQQALAYWRISPIAFFFFLTAYPTAACPVALGCSRLSCHPQ